MMRFSKFLGLVGALALAAPTSAWANGFNSWRVCGGSNFATCAAVSITVSGKDVTVNVWNLSGNTGASFGTTTWSGTIFNGIGFYHVPGPINVIASSLTVSGPVRAGNTPGTWQLSNNSSIAFPIDIATKSPGGTGSTTNGISSGCASPPSILPGPPPQLYQNPCVTSLFTAGFVTFKFKLTAASPSWDPSTSSLVLRGYNGPGGPGTATECWTDPNPPFVAHSNCFLVSPEPVSMTLLATGLASMGGVGFLRRRKKGNSPIV